MRKGKRMWIVAGAAVTAAISGIAYLTLFYCKHDWSRPFVDKFSVPPPKGVEVKGTVTLNEYYVVCLKCTKQRYYDVDTMKMGGTRNDRNSLASTGRGTRWMVRPVLPPEESGDQEKSDTREPTTAK